MISGRGPESAGTGRTAFAGVCGCGNEPEGSTKACHRLLVSDQGHLKIAFVTFILLCMSELGKQSGGR